MRNKITDNNHLQELLLVVNLVKSRLTSLKYYLHHTKSLDVLLLVCLQVIYKGTGYSRFSPLIKNQHLI